MEYVKSLMDRLSMYHPRKRKILGIIYIAYASSIIFFIIKAIANPHPKGILVGFLGVSLVASFFFLFVCWITKVIIGKYIRCESCFWLCGFSDLQHNNGVCPECGWDRFAYPELRLHYEHDLGESYMYTVNQRQTLTQIKLANKEKKIWKSFRIKPLLFEWWRMKYKL